MPPISAIEALSEFTRFERRPRSIGMPMGATAPPKSVTMYLNKSFAVALARHRPRHTVRPPTRMVIPRPASTNSGSLALGRNNRR